MKKSEFYNADVHLLFKEDTMCRLVDSDLPELAKDSGH